MSQKQVTLETLSSDLDRIAKLLTSMAVLARPPLTQFESIRVPSVPRSTAVNVNIAAGGGTADMLSGLTNRVRKVIGGYVRQTAGAARNFQIEVFNGTSAFPVSDNDTNSKKTLGINNIRAGDTLRINAVAAADQGTWQGWVFHDDFGFPPLT